MRAWVTDTNKKARPVSTAFRFAVSMQGSLSIYTRAEAAFPLAWVREAKFFPYVTKIDNGYGDRNLCCCLLYTSRCV